VKRRYSEAIVDFSTAINLNSTAAEYFLNRGVSYRKLKDFDKSLADLNKTIALDSSNAKAFYNRGLLKASQMQYDEAVKDYNRALNSMVQTSKRSTIVANRAPT